MRAFHSIVIVALAIALGLAGCSSPARPQGDIHLGDTPALVETELGSPSRKLQRFSTDGHETVWIYRHYRMESPVEKRPGEKPGSDQEDLKMHVVFRNGRVSYVEYLK